MGGSVKRHMLDEMRQALLVIVFQNRARVQDEAKFGALFRPPVFANEIPHTVGEFSLSNGRIEGKRVLYRSIRGVRFIVADRVGYPS